MPLAWDKFRRLADNILGDPEQGIILAYLDLLAATHGQCE
jgi:hypothetical protein